MKSLCKQAWVYVSAPLRPLQLVLGGWGDGGVGLCVFLEALAGLVSASWRVGHVCCSWEGQLVFANLSRSSRQLCVQRPDGGTRADGSSQVRCADATQSAPYDRPAFDQKANFAALSVFTLEDCRPLFDQRQWKVSAVSFSGNEWQEGGRTAWPFPATSLTAPRCLLLLWFMVLLLDVVLSL